MLILNRNKQTLYYANPVGKDYVTDSNGLKTGRKQITYGEHVATTMNIPGNNIYSAFIIPYDSGADKYLDEKGIEYKEFGTFSDDSVDYPIYAYKVAKAVYNKLK